MSHFSKEAADYQRDIDILNSYYQQMAMGLARSTGYSYEYCLNYVTEQCQNGPLRFEDPQLDFVGKQSNGDRCLKSTTFLKYLATIERNDLIVSPSLAIYKNIEQERSLSAIYVNAKVKARKKAKAEMFQAFKEGDEQTGERKDNEQMSRKIKANSLSGAHSSPSTVLYHNPIHSSLTSMCRSATSYGNAHNERLIAGNRHYWNPDVVINNILSTIHTCDLDLYEQVIERHGLHRPSIEETMQVIERSTYFYWHNPRRMQEIRELVCSLSSLERSAFVYSGDFYHLVYFNPTFGQHFLESLAYQPPAEKASQYSPECLKRLTNEAEILVNNICANLLQGNTLDDYNQLEVSTQNALIATAGHLLETLDYYQDLISAVFVNRAMPASIAMVPSIIRRCAITSDTDSTIYTVQDWIRWYRSKVQFDEYSIRIGHVVSFLSSATIVHILAQMSANLGVHRDQLFDYSMKSEFFFPVFALTPRAKTYFASTGAREGQIYKNPEEEVETKGPVFKGSNAPQQIVERVHELLGEILYAVRTEEGINLQERLQEVADLERQIIRSIKQGDTSLFKKVEIKPADAYKQSPSQSPHFHYLLWEHVFAPKYGRSEEPPYDALKVTLAANSPRQFSRYLESLEDRELAERFKRFLQAHGKDKIGSIHLPRINVIDQGMPEEILSQMDTRNMLANLLEPFYVILESLGVYILDENNMRLASDFY